jgi:TRAP-type C4-dicarboxylate transport system permease small subunit
MVAISEDIATISMLEGGIFMEKMLRYLDKALSVILVVLLGIMVLAVTCSVFSRFIIGKGISWSDELSEFTFIWSTFVGATIGLIRKKHISIQSQLAKLPAQLKKVILIFSNLLMIAFSGIVLVYGLKLLKICSLQASPVLGINLAVLYAILPFTAGLMILILLADIFRILTGKEGGPQLKC